MAGTGKDRRDKSCQAMGLGGLQGLTGQLWYQVFGAISDKLVNQTGTLAEVGVDILALGTGQLAKGSIDGAFAGIGWQGQRLS